MLNDRDTTEWEHHFRCFENRKIEKSYFFLLHDCNECDLNIRFSMEKKNFRFRFRQM